MSGQLIGLSPSKQLVIMQRLTAQLQGITPANGYYCDLSASVFRGKSIFGTEVAPPYVSILESLRPDPRPRLAGPEKMQREESWDLLVQGWTQPQDLMGQGVADVPDDHPTDALYQLMAVVTQRLARVIATVNGAPIYPDEYRLGRIITTMQIGPGVVRAATPQLGGVEAFYLPVTVGYVTNVADPFSLS